MPRQTNQEAVTASGWTVDFLTHVVFREMGRQERDIRANFEEITKIIEDEGLEYVSKKYVKRVHDKLWEMRLRGRQTIARALYLTVTGNRVMVCRVFTKKTQRTPRREIELALKRAKEAGHG